MKITAQTAMALVEKHAQYCEYAGQYGEPGYTDPNAGILFANWNDVPQRLAEALERKGFELEWSDEWLISYETDKAYRCQPDSYSWQPSYLCNDWTNGEVIGADELREDATDYIDEYLVNNPDVADQFGIDLYQYDFEPLEKGENGWYEGQNDNPADMLARAQKFDPDADFVFQINSVGQFDVRFELWIRKTDAE